MRKILQLFVEIMFILYLIGVVIVFIPSQSRPPLFSPSGGIGTTYTNDYDETFVFKETGWEEINSEDSFTNLYIILFGLALAGAIYLYRSKN